MKRLIPSLLSLGLILIPLAASAGQVLQRVEQTGVIRAGARKDAIPFGYVNAQGKWQGYSIDILELIRVEAEQKLKRPVKLELVEVTPETRFQKLRDGAIDIECGTSTFTWDREKLVDFTLRYFANGTQLLTRQDSGLGSIPSLVGKRIGIVPGTTNATIIRALQPAAEFLLVNDRLDGFRKLEAGQLDAFASDGITLEGLQRQAAQPQLWSVVPEAPYVIEGYACTVPEDESQWRDLVNRSLAQFMQGVVTGDPGAIALIDRWFGPKGIAPYPRDQISDYFQATLSTLEWLPTLSRPTGAPAGQNSSP
jgi:polar amino acid transport system substrate-binding protein